MTERPGRQSVSPINTPTQPTSEPPTPTTGHVTVNSSYPSYLSQSSNGVGKDKGDILMPLVWNQRSFPKSNVMSLSSSQHLSQFSITSSARSVKSMGSSIIDTDFENETDAPVPLAINATAGVGVDGGGGAAAAGNDQEDDDLSQDPCPRGGISKNSNLPTQHGLQQDLLWEFLSDFKEATLSSIHDIRMQQKRDMERLVSMLQNESNRRQALEGRMHAQLLLQAETMVAMEVKLLKLEAKVEKRELLKRRVSGGAGGGGSNLMSSLMTGNHTGGQGNTHGNFQSISHGLQSMNVEGRTGSIVANETIDEEESDEDFGMKDIREIQVRTNTAANDAASGITQATSGTGLVTGGTASNPGGGLDDSAVSASAAASVHGTVGSGIRGGHGQGHHVVVSNSHSKHDSNRERIHLNASNPTNIVMSSGISLASGVTATSFLEESHGVEYPQVSSPTRNDGDEDDDDDEEEDASARSNDGDVEDECDRRDIVEEDASESTPTQGRTRRDYRLSEMHPVTNLESILLNSNQSPCPSELGLSTRAVRGDYDGNSSLATSVTNTTVTSTIITSTTKGNDSTTRQAVNESGIEVEVATAASGVSYGNDLANSTASMSQRGDFMLALSPQPNTEDQERPPRNESPLTVQSGATETRSVGQSVASASVGTSILSTAAVAPTRSFRARREAAARYGNYQDGRSLANRVVSFTSDQVFLPPPEISEAGDSITMPDELDNLSDVADEFAARARLWRDEYEARLDAIQKKWIGE